MQNTPCTSKNTSDKREQCFRVVMTPFLFLSEEETRKISTPPGWDASPSQYYPQHYMYVHPVGKGTVRVHVVQGGPSKF